MRDSSSIRSGKPFTLAELVVACGLDLPAGADAERSFRGLASVERASRDEVAVVGAGTDPDELTAMRAEVCLVAAHDVERLPAGIIGLVVDRPWLVYAQAIARFCRTELVPGAIFDRGGVDPAAVVHVEARLEPDVVIEPGAVIGPRVEIGSGTIIGSNSVIAADVSIGRGCIIDSQVSIRQALIGDRVVIYAGARIGVGGARPLAGSDLETLPLIGRVIIQDGAEIGANAAIERGCVGDTTIGEGARVATLVIVDADTTVPRFACFTGPVGREMASRSKMV